MPAASRPSDAGRAAGIGEVRQQVRVGRASAPAAPTARAPAGAGGASHATHVAIDVGERGVRAGVAQRRRQRVAAEQHRHRVGGAAVDAARVDRRAARQQEPHDRRRSIAPDRPVQRGLAAPVRLVRIGAGVEQQRRAGHVLAIEHVLQHVLLDARPRREQQAQALEVGVLGRVIDRFVVVDARRRRRSAGGRAPGCCCSRSRRRGRGTGCPGSRGVSKVAFGSAPRASSRRAVSTSAARARRVALRVAREADVGERRHRQRAGRRRVGSRSPRVDGAGSTASASPRTSAWNGLAVASAGVGAQQGVGLGAILRRGVEEVAGHARSIAQPRRAARTSGARRSGGTRARGR